MPSILIVTVNFRVGPLCVRALESLEPEVSDLRNCRVVIVDNASGDGSADEIESAILSHGWSSWASLIRSPVNGGFSAGNNLAIAPALASAEPPDYVHLLNPDTIVRPGAVRALATFLDAHPAAGIAGSCLESEDGIQQHSCFRFPSLRSEIDTSLSLGLVTRLLRNHVITLHNSTDTRRVDWVSGASMMIRRAVFERIGLLDEGYFLYFEELDFCLHAAREGWESWSVGESRVVHLVGRSSHINLDLGEQRHLPPYWFRSRRRYWTKNHGLAFAIWVDAVTLVCEAVRRTRLLIQRQPDRRPRGFALGLLRIGFSRGERRDPR